MLKSKISSLLLIVLLTGVTRATDVMFCFDAEDYTSSKSCDVLRDLAKLMSEEQVTAQFNVVGYLARQIRQQGRQDVVSAMKAHQVGSHTLYFAKRPTMAELTDIADADQAYRLAMAEESMSLGLIKTSFNVRDVSYYVPSGPYSYAAMYAVSDLGMTFCMGSWLNGLSRGKGAGFWYCGLYQLPMLEPSVFSLEDLLPPNPEPDYAAVLDRLAERSFAGLRIESSRIACRRPWTEVNFDPARPVAFGSWKDNPARSAADVRVFSDRLRRLIRAIQADERFRFVTVSDVFARFSRRRVTVQEIPEVRREVMQHLGPIEDMSLSLADVYGACIEFLRGGTVYVPGRTRGFLSRPQGVTKATRVSADDLRRLAEKYSGVDYIPSKMEVGTCVLGPADFLFAALEVLETGATSVTVVPREQVGDASVTWPAAGTDRFLSERLRLQYWTLRYEKQ